ncbi:MAG TPA: T9SS type A sorting domain-containing protein, partial [bacterium]|nr:T9SS type A sorting domain-containing protein [bacterium]
KWTPPDVPDRWIRGLSIGPDRSVWVSSDGGLARFSGGKWQILWSFNNTFSDVHVAADGMVWTLMDGVYRFLNSTWVKVSGGPMYSNGPLYAVSASDVWVGGIHYNDGKWTVHTEANGFLGCTDIEMDGTSRVWAATGVGAVRFDPNYLDVHRSESVPEEVLISGNNPNPFNPNTVIIFSIPRNGKAELSIYDITGRKVKSLISQEWATGLHTVRWDGRNDGGKAVSSGIYIAHLRAGGMTASRRMALVR